MIRVDYNSGHRNPTTLSNLVPKKFHPYVGKYFTNDEHHVHYHVQGYKPLAWAIPLSDDTFEIKSLNAGADFNRTLARVIQCFAKKIKRRDIDNYNPPAIMSWIEDSIKEYYSWLKDKTDLRKNEQTGWFTITTPFTGLYNDNIEIYVKKEDEKVILSDDGLTLSNLELSGAAVARSPKRKEWLGMILLNYGITLLNNNELETIATERDFVQKKYNLICAISEISDMSMMAKHTVSSLFREDVKTYLDEQDIIYTPQFIAKGNTGIEFTFDFQIAGKNSELVIKSFNSLNKINVPNFLFAWEDIKETREKISDKELKGMAVINNIDKDIKSEYLEALKSKNAGFVFWSDRHQPKTLSKLVA